MTNFYVKYQVVVEISIPGFGENQKARRLIQKTGSEYFENSSNDFRQIRSINSLSEAFSNALVVYCSNTDKSPD